MPGPLAKTVLLFYREPEKDAFFPGDRYLKRLVRPAYNLVRKGPATSGFFVLYQNLIAALQRCGAQVERNNHALARRYPDHPVGLVGYPCLLEGWDLPNPALIGPGMYDHPKIRPDLMDDPRYHRYLVHCRWLRHLFEPVYGPCISEWWVGIDTTAWADTRGQEKTLDLLVYDKTRAHEPRILEPVLRAIDARGLSRQVLRYGRYKPPAYQELLRRARGVVFLSAHETQGLAYQEALASNVPVLAWDQGYWLDPIRPRYEPEPVPATSVPFFSPECGERFRDEEEFPAALERFWASLPAYEPRRFVERELSLRCSGEIYLEYYQALRSGAQALRGEAPQALTQRA
jgi:hypothetical protein